MLRRATSAINRINVGHPTHTSPQAKFGLSFEWTAHCDGWNETARAEIRELKRLPPIAIRCDGCTQGLRARSGLLMRKLWTIAASLPMMVHQLAHRCRGGHEHAQVRGRDAIQSSFYSPRMICGLVDGLLTAPVGDSRAAREAFVGARKRSRDEPASTEEAATRR